MSIRYTLYDLSQRINDITISGGITALSGTGGITIVEADGVWFIDGSTISGTTISGTDGIVASYTGGVWFIDLQSVDGGNLG